MIQLFEMLILARERCFGDKIDFVRARFGSMMFFCLFGLVLLCFHWVSAERGAHLKAMQQHLSNTCWMQWMERFRPAFLHVRITVNSLFFSLGDSRFTFTTSH